MHMNVGINTWSQYIDNKAALGHLLFLRLKLFLIPVILNCAHRCQVEPSSFLFMGQQQCAL